MVGRLSGGPAGQLYAVPCRAAIFYRWSRQASLPNQCTEILVLYDCASPIIMCVPIGSCPVVTESVDPLYAVDFSNPTFTCFAT